MAPHLTAALLSRSRRPTPQELTLIQCLSLLLLGMSLSTLATLNFSLALLVGLCAAPLSFVRPMPRRPAVAAALALLLSATSPVAVVLGSCWGVGRAFVDVLVEASFGWHVWGMWTQVVVWLVWWPAWFAGSVVVASSFFGGGEDGVKEM